MKTEDVHQTLIDEVNNHLNENLGEREDILSGFSERHQAAVRLKDLHYQVNNGGFSQWDVNGYSNDVQDLLGICDNGVALGLDSFKKLKKLIITFKEMPTEQTYYEDVECQECDGKGRHYSGEDEEQCDYCGGEGEVSEEKSNDGEREMIYNKLDEDYYALNTVESDMNTLLTRWEEIESVNVETYNVYADGTYKPDCHLKGIDGNVFVIIGHVSNTLKKAGIHERAEQFVEEARNQKSYDNVFALLSDYVNIKI